MKHTTKPSQGYKPENKPIPLCFGGGGEFGPEDIPIG